MAFLPVIAAVAAVAGAGVSAYSAYEAGQAKKNAANYNAQVADNNAKIAGQNADYAIAAGNQKAFNTSLKGAARLGAVKAAQAAGGVDVNSGSALDVQESERAIDKLDAETVLNNAQLTAYGYRSQKTGFDATSKLDTMSGKQAEIGGDLGAAGSLLSGASSLGFKWSGLPGGAGTGSGFTGELPDSLPENI